jgi:hypothetical protein
VFLKVPGVPGDSLCGWWLHQDQVERGVLGWAKTCPKRKMLVWSLTSPRPPSSPRVSPNRLPLMRHRTSSTFLGIGVPIGTDAFVQNNFPAKSARVKNSFPAESPMDHYKGFTKPTVYGPMTQSRSRDMVIQFVVFNLSSPFFLCDKSPEADSPVLYFGNWVGQQGYHINTPEPDAPVHCFGNWEVPTRASQLPLFTVTA